jgi:FMN phosphatase YigB (HAD superfamily)
MYKKITLLFFTSLFALQSLNADNSVNKKYNPNTAIIAWDFHDVLVHKNWWAMLQRIGKILNESKNRWQLVKVIPSILFDAYKIKDNCSSAEELIAAFLNKYPVLAPHKKELLMVINQHEPNNESVKILRQLKKEGYRNFLASNIGKTSLKIMQQLFPRIFKQFDGDYIPQTESTLGYQSLIAKPCIEYYQEFRDYLKTKGIDKQTAIIFIDDNIKNIEAANNSGLNIIGILFTSPEQLNTDLNNLLEQQAE